MSSFAEARQGLLAVEGQLGFVDVQIECLFALQAHNEFALG
jgi:hypothetical protein